MADEAEEAAEDAEAKPKRGLFASKKKLIVIAAAAVLLLGGGGGAAFFLMGGEEPPVEAEAEVAGGMAEMADTEQGPGVFYEMPGMLVNLAVEGQRQAYLRVSTTLEIRNVSYLADTREKSAAIIDGFQTFLREMRPRDISGSGGLMRLKEELLVRANAAIGQNAVRNVLLTEFLVQ